MRAIAAYQRAVAVVVGAEHVDRAVEAALELVDEVDDVGGVVGRRSALSAERTSTRSLSSPYADERAQSAPSVS